MSNVLKMTLIVFSIILFLVTLYNIRKGKIPIKYSLIWFITSLVILSVGLFPSIVMLVAESVGITTLTSLIIGVILTLLLIITMTLTIIVSNQNKKIKNLIQEISIIKSRKE